MKTILILILLCSSVSAQDGVRIHRHKHYDTTRVEDFQKIKRRRLTTDVDSTGIVMRAWGDEAFFKVKLRKRTDVLDNYVTGEINGRPFVKYGNNSFRYRMYVNKGGSFEFDAIIRSKPASGRYFFPFNIQSKSLVFHFQPPLTQEEIDDGDFRPDSVINSYAVYHSTRGGGLDGVINKANGVVEHYTTGKAFHLYRPKVWDNAGDTVWGFIEIDTVLGRMKIGADSTWMTNAVFPVTIDPTFGLTTQGATASGNASDSQWGLGPFSPSSNGDVTTVQFYSEGILNEDFTVGLFDDVSSVPKNLLRDSGGGTGADNGWQEQTLDSDLPVTSGTNYWLSIAFDIGATQYYDAVSGFDRERVDQSTDTYVSGAMTDPFPTTTLSATRKYSIYATYTETGGAAKIMRVIIQ